MPKSTEREILVPISAVREWRLEWLAENDPQDGTDCVTPFDHVLYKPDYFHPYAFWFTVVAVLGVFLGGLAIYNGHQLINLQKKCNSSICVEIPHAKK